MAIAGFNSPDGGTIGHGERVLFDSGARRDIPAEQRDLGVVFQSYALWPHLTVGENVAFPLRIRRVGRAEIKRRVGEVLDLVELGHRADAHPHELSGGQQQRVALARALAHGPTALLLDEPFSNLDAKLRDRAREWLGRLQRELGMTTVFVTHDQTEALAMSDQILVMNGGRIVRAGTPEEVYRRPGSRFAAQFLGRCNFLTGTAHRISGDEYQLEAPDLPGPVRFRAPDTPAPRLATVAVRPESLRLSDGTDGAEAGWPANVVHTTFLGDHYLHTLRAGAQVVLEAVTIGPLATGTVRVAIDESATSLVTDDQEEFDNVL
jgi:iron(III) transport system ATP-binding protein